MRNETQPPLHKRCWFFHNWYSHTTCATYAQTGPLPGENHYTNGLGQPGYRYERVCRDCRLREYNAFNRWMEIPLPLAKR